MLLFASSHQVQVRTRSRLMSPNLCDAEWQAWRSSTHLQVMTVRWFCPCLRRTCCQAIPAPKSCLISSWLQTRRQIGPCGDSLMRRPPLQPWRTSTSRRCYHPTRSSWRSFRLVPDGGRIQDSQAATAAPTVCCARLASMLPPPARARPVPRGNTRNRRAKARAKPALPLGQHLRQAAAAAPTVDPDRS